MVCMSKFVRVVNDTTDRKKKEKVNKCREKEDVKDKIIALKIHLTYQANM